MRAGARSALFRRPSFSAPRAWRPMPHMTDEMSAKRPRILRLHSVAIDASAVVVAAKASDLAGSFSCLTWEGKKVTKLLSLVGFLSALIPAQFAAAGDSSPYLVGHWSLNNKFVEFAGAAPIITDNTEFIFLNPTPLTLTLEYAFFDSAGTFCGCDRDALTPNGRTIYTMVGEKHGGQFSTKLCPTQTEGIMKTIVYVGKSSDGNVIVGDALQAGFQIDFFRGVSDNGAAVVVSGNAAQPQGGGSEADLKAVDLNKSTKDEIQQIHQGCVKFIGN